MIHISRCHFGFAPFYTLSSENLLEERLGRFACHPDGWTEEIEKKYPGIYNIRIEGLESENKTWASLFGSKHCIFIFQKHYENVAKKDYLKGQGLKKVDIDRDEFELEFSPKNSNFVVAAGLYNIWIKPDGKELFTFGIITDDPPEEIERTGHDRCPVFLKNENLKNWLDPSQLSKSQLIEILKDPVSPFYQHSILRTA